MALPSTLQSLPIAALDRPIREKLAAHNRLIIKAPPGAGKSTAVPLMLLETLQPGERIIMLQPRRLATRSVASRLADLLGGKLGDRVGYQIRDDRRVGAQSQIIVVTEGILTQMLQSDPALEGVRAVIFDEFHERNLHSDLALALLRESQEALRGDLKLLLMSATLDESLPEKLQAPLLETRGRSFAVDLHHLDPQTPRPTGAAIAPLAAQKAQEALKKHGGDLLIFLPGQAEINACAAILEKSVSPDVAVVPLFGLMDSAAQRRAIAPPPPNQRKVVIATNIAETSLTIEGITVVIDSGYERVMGYDHASAMGRLKTVRISPDSATQRAGRAGRMGPGICYRLWHTHEPPLAPKAAEIERADLSALVLTLARWGARKITDLAWITPPPQAAFEAAQRQLMALGAIDSSGALTPHGAAIEALGIHPRLGHMVLVSEGKERDTAVLLAALLSEPGTLLKPGADLPAALNQLARTLKSGHTTPATQAAQRLFKRLKQPQSAPIQNTAIGYLLALAYPDRIAMQREESVERYQLSGGKGARIDRRDPLFNTPFLVALWLGGNAQEPRITLAASLSLKTIQKRLNPRTQTRLFFDADRLKARKETRLGALVLFSQPTALPPGASAAEALIEMVQREGFETLGVDKKARGFLDRIAFLNHHTDRHNLKLPDLNPDALVASAHEWLAPYLSGITDRAGLRGLNWLAIFEGFLDYETLQRVKHLAPERLRVPSGSKLLIDYGDGHQPMLAVRLQELLGMDTHPAILDGRVALLLHLLSPARRPIQITADLPGFWRGSYESVRKEMAARYPKHLWPADPLSTPPTTRTKKRAKLDKHF
jgi:ATP-dependent helicase HrpB